MPLIWYRHRSHTIPSWTSSHKCETAFAIVSRCAKLNADMPSPLLPLSQQRQPMPPISRPSTIVLALYHAALAILIPSSLCRHHHGEKPPTVPVSQALWLPTHLLATPSLPKNNSDEEEAQCPTRLHWSVVAPEPILAALLLPLPLAPQLLNKVLIIPLWLVDIILT